MEERNLVSSSFSASSFSFFNDLSTDHVGELWHCVKHFFQFCFSSVTTQICCHTLACGKTISDCVDSRGCILNSANQFQCRSFFKSCKSATKGHICACSGDHWYPSSVSFLHLHIDGSKLNVFFSLWKYCFDCFKKKKKPFQRFNLQD